MTLIKINSINMPNPQKYSFPMQDVMGGSTTNENGVTFRNRVRQGVRSIELAWLVGSPLASLILGNITEDKVTVTFLDPWINDYRTAEMYVGDRSCELMLLDDIGSASNLWSISFTLTEY